MEFVSSTTIAGTASALGSMVQGNVDSVWTLALLAVSLPLAFYVVRMIIGLFPKGKTR